MASLDVKSPYSRCTRERTALLLQIVSFFVKVDRAAELAYSPKVNEQHFKTETK